MFNNWIANGLGKLSAILAWALGDKSDQLSGEERTEIILVSSIPDREVRLVSGLCFQKTLISSITMSINRLSGFSASKNLVSEFCKRLDLASSIKTRILNEVINIE